MRRLLAKFKDGSPIGPEWVLTVDKYITFVDGQAYLIEEKILTKSGERVKVMYS